MRLTLCKDSIFKPAQLLLAPLTALLLLTSNGVAQPLIRSVDIELLDVFADSDGAFYRAINSLKINTRKEVIERELEFKVGDPLDEFALQDSERRLRSLKFFHDVSITPSIEGNYADILVRVRDTWTLIPTVDYSSGSGNEDKRSVGIADSNLLGFGKRLEFKLEENDRGDELQFVWDDQRLLNTYNRLELGFFDRTDGDQLIGNFGRQFYSLLDPYSWFVRFNISDEIGRLYEDGDENFIFGQETDNFAAGYTWVFGDPESNLIRLTGGLEYSDKRFREATDQDVIDADLDDPDKLLKDPSLVPRDRRFSYPFVGVRTIEPDFISEAYIDRFTRVQDINLGTESFAELGFASKLFGASESALLFQIGQQRGWRLSSQSFIRGELSLASRANSSAKFENSLIRNEWKFYHTYGDLFWNDQWLGNHTFASSLLMEYGRNFDGENELLAGATNGLRGYEAAAFSGDNALS